MENQFQIHEDHVVNGDFASAEAWPVEAGEDVQIGNGRLSCGGSGRNIVLQSITGFSPGDDCLLIVDVVSGGGSCTFGTRGLNLSPGRHAVFGQAAPDMALQFDFEEVACEVENVALHKVTFAT